jgi:hypothetical protein
MASIHKAGTGQETDGATIDQASRTASRLTNLADQVPPNAPARVPTPLPPRAARRPSWHGEQGLDLPQLIAQLGLGRHRQARG